MATRFKGPRASIARSRTNPSSATIIAFPSQRPGEMPVTEQERALLAIHRHLSYRGRQLLLAAMRELLIDHSADQR